MNKMIRFLLLIPVSFLTLFVLYPILHEAGHAILTWILGGRVSGFSLLPNPHIESGLPYDKPGSVAAVSLGGIALPILVSLPFLRWRGYKGYVVVLVLLISGISSVIELCIVFQYTMGDVVPEDDIVLFLTSSGVRPIWAILYTLCAGFVSTALLIRMKPLELIAELAGRS